VKAYPTILMTILASVNQWRNGPMKTTTEFWNLAETMGIYFGSAGLGAVIGTVFWITQS
jgi:hypothetical protein